jgi:hypothetical protein
MVQSSMEKSMSRAARLLIAGAVLSIAGPALVGRGEDVEHLRSGQRVAQLKKDPETDPGGLPGRADDRPRTRGIAPSSPQRPNRTDEQEQQKSKPAPTTPETDSAKSDKSEKR